MSQTRCSQNKKSVYLFIFLVCFLAGNVDANSIISGKAQQGGLMFWQTTAGSRVFLDKQEIDVSATGKFVIGFGRDEVGQRTLTLIDLNGEEELHVLDIVAREYAIERVDGLPPSTVTPAPSAQKRIQEEAAMVSSARSRRDDRTDYDEGFAWPAIGRISGVYGSQRVLNGKPKRPHYGLDIAAPEGSPVYAPADGIITLAHDDLYFSGGTMILDHGQGLTSTFLHLSKILVESGTVVTKGALIAEIGSTGRASGPHLDWRMNWLDRRVDPQLLLEGVDQTQSTP